MNTPEALINAVSIGCGLLMCGLLVFFFNTTGVTLEGQLFTQVSFWLLVASAAGAFLRASEADEQRAGLLWGLVGGGFFYLALDEYFQFHERLDVWLHRVLDIQETPLTDQLDGVIVLVYGLGAIWLVRALGKVSPPSRQMRGWLLAAFGCFAVMVLLDLLDTGAAWDNDYFEESTKLVAEYFFFLACVRDLPLRRSPHALSPEVRFAIIVAVLLSLALMATLVFPRIHYTWFWLTRKDRLIDNLTFWLFLAAGVVQGLTLKTCAPTQQPAEQWVLRFWCMFFLAAAGEEINWGQTFFDFPSPQFFLEHNEERVVSLHNFASVAFNRAFYGFAFLVGVVFPAVGLLVPTTNTTLRQWGVSAPSFGVSLLFMLSFAHISPQWLVLSPEGYVYLYGSIAWLLFVLGRWEHFRLSFVHAGFVAAVVAALLLTHLSYVGYEAHVGSRNRPNEVKECLLGWAFLVYALTMWQEYRDGQRAHRRATQA